MGKFKFPSAYTILFFLIAVVAVLTWIIPAGQYHMAMNEALGKDVPVAGTYAHVAAHPQGLVSVLMAPIAGLYDPEFRPGRGDRRSAVYPDHRGISRDRHQNRGDRRRDRARHHAITRA